MAKVKLGKFKTVTSQKRSSKGKKGKSQLDEVSFDDKARAEYLTGFRKRKLAKKKKAQEKALLAEKEEKSVFRKEKRDKLKLVEKDMERIDEIQSQRSLKNHMKIITVD